MMRAAPPTYKGLRITIPAREALESALNEVSPDGERDQGGAPTWRLTLTGRIPTSLRAVVVPEYDERGVQYGYQERWCLRLADEPPYPSEQEGMDMWTRAALTIGCPYRGCGRALVWAEAGYVPGHRVCTAGHCAQLDDRCERAVRA